MLVALVFALSKAALAWSLTKVSVALLAALKAALALSNAKFACVKEPLASPICFVIYLSFGESYCI